jgi:hypothetical protein
VAAHLRVYHDESVHGPWFVTGLVWVPVAGFDEAAELLHGHRVASGFWGESHFKDFPGSRERREYGDACFAAFRNCRLGQCHFSALVVDKRPPNFESGTFDERFHLYNRFTAMAIWSGFRRFWRDWTTAEIEVVSDSRPRARRGPRPPDGVTTDNFEVYLPRRFAEDARKEYPVRAPGITGVRVIPSATERNPGERKPNEDLLQLSDLLCGAVAQAFSRSSRDSTKTNFGAQMRTMANMTLKRSWESRPSYCDRLAISQFPDSDGMMRRTRFEFARPGLRKLEEFP